MFTFLNTSILTGLLAISIPLLIHLLTKKKVKRIDFSSLYFLKELKTQKIRRIKIRQILLMIIRTLIILFLILAFARPTLKGTLSPVVGNKAKTSAVMIIDNSMSMGRMVRGRSMFEIVREKVRQLENVFADGDELYAITVSPGTPPVYPDARYQPAAMEKAVTSLDVSEESTDIIAALLRAKELLDQSHNINKEVYLFSDVQRSGFLGLETVVNPIFEGTDIRIFVQPITSIGSSNLTISDVKLKNQIIEKGKLVEVEVTISNTGVVEETNKLVQLFIDEKRSAQATVQLKPGERQRLSFKIIPDKSRLISGSVLLDDDDLSLDNRRYFVFYVPDKIKVLLVGTEQKDIQFLKIAIGVSPNIQSQEKLASQLISGCFDGSDVVILSNVARMSEGIRHELIQFVDQGNGLIIAPGANMDLEYYNTWLNEPLSLPEFINQIGEPDNQQSFMSFGKIDFSHPIFQGMFDEKPESVDSPLLFAALAMKNNSKAQVIVELSNHIPFLIESRAERGHVQFFNTTMNGDWSDFPIKGVFVPMINRSVLYLSGSTERMDRDRLIQNTLAVSMANSTDVTDLVIQKPDESKHKVKPEINDSQYQVSFGETDETGFYQLYSGDDRIDMWAVNFEPTESEYQPIETDKLVQLIGEDRAVVLNDKQLIAEQVTTSRYGRELWKAAVLLVFVLLIGEMIIGREGEKASK
ncbi:BatA domain-containing protein [candidate division KSB1 bacterium]|nr:BatA domain-containing protein [candidate division KSB1 bacterium]